MFTSRQRTQSLGSTSQLAATNNTIPATKEQTAQTSDDNTPCPPEWQRVPTARGNKRKKLSESPSPETIKTNNRYHGLQIDLTEDEPAQKEKRSYKPPPIILYGIEDINKLSDLINTVANKDDYLLKIVNKNQLRINPLDLEVYKKIISLVRENGLIGHTFNRRDQRCCRLVIKKLHHSTPHIAIIEEFEKTGNKIQGEIINVKYGPEKLPTSTFFVNLETGPNNNAAKSIKSINNQIVIIEEPKKRNTIPQCQRCQQYGHSKNYCMRPYRCVKCAQSHKTSECPKKDRNSPATCALCEGAHPANYRGCEVYKEILLRKTGRKMPLNENNSHTTMQNKTSIARQPIISAEPNEQQPKVFDRPKQKNRNLTGAKTYADALKTDPTAHENNLDILLTQQAIKLDKLLEQMSTMMNLLTTLINKLIH